MVKTMLDSLDIKNKMCRFVKPPKGTYAVWFDTILSRGADEKNLIKEHSYTIELYSGSVDEYREKQIEKYLNDHGIEFTKQDITWIESEQLYMVVYDFNIIEKKV